MRFERQHLTCINGNNNFRIERDEKEAMLAAGTLPIRVATTVHALHSYNLMQGENESEDRIVVDWRSRRVIEPKR